MTILCLGPVFWIVISMYTIIEDGIDDYEVQEGIAFCALLKMIEAFSEAFPQTLLQSYTLGQLNFATGLHLVTISTSLATGIYTAITAVKEFMMVDESYSRVRPSFAFDNLPSSCGKFFFYSSFLMGFPLFISYFFSISLFASVFGGPYLSLILLVVIEVCLGLLNTSFFLNDFPSACRILFTIFSIALHVVCTCVILTVASVWLVSAKSFQVDAVIRQTLNR
jgi:hypothetical protein